MSEQMSELSVEIRPFEAGDAAAVQAMIARVPEGDRTFFKEDARDASYVESWADAPGRRLIAVDGDRVLGCVGVIPLTGWSEHVGEVRLVVDPQARGQGLGRVLARGGLLAALELGLHKIFVEVVSSEVRVVRMFEANGFEPEGVLRGHVRDAEGQAHDLVVLAHQVDETWAGMLTAGIDEAVGA